MVAHIVFFTAYLAVLVIFYYEAYVQGKENVPLWVTTLSTASDFIATCLMLVITAKVNTDFDWSHGSSPKIFSVVNSQLVA